MRPILKATEKKAHKRSLEIDELFGKWKENDTALHDNDLAFHFAQNLLTNGQ